MKPILAIGMMSGTSVDGVVDAAAISDRWRCDRSAKAGQRLPL